MGIFDGWFKREFLRLVRREGLPVLVRSHDRHLIDEYRAVYGEGPSERDLAVMRVGASGLIKGITSL